MSVSCECCQVKASAKGRSFLQGPVECVCVIECDLGQQ